MDSATLSKSKSQILVSLVCLKTNAWNSAIIRSSFIPIADYEEFESLINDENKLKSDITSLFKLNWNYGIAASIAILISLIIFLNPLEYTNTELVSVDFNGTEEELLADETMIESLFVDDSEFDDWFEERYVLNTVN